MQTHSQTSNQKLEQGKPVSEAVSYGIKHSTVYNVEQKHLVTKVLLSEVWG